MLKLLVSILEIRNTYKIVLTKSKEEGFHVRRKHEWEYNVWGMSCGADLDGSRYGTWACKNMIKFRVL